MSHLIITAIIVLSVAKVKAQAKDNLTNSKWLQLIDAEIKRNALAVGTRHGGFDL